MLGDRHADRRAVRRKPAVLIPAPAGMTSFGHAAYFGIGAYASALAAKHACTRSWQPSCSRRSRRASAALVFGCVLRAPVRRLPCDADARVRADRVVDRAAMGCGDRRIERHHRRLAAGWLADRHALLLVRAVRRCGAALVALVVDRRSRRSAMRCARSRDSPLRAAAIGIDVRARADQGVRARRRLRRPGRRALRFSKGSISPDASRFRARSMRW